MPRKFSRRMATFFGSMALAFAGTAQAGESAGSAEAYLQSTRALEDLGKINDQFISNFIHNDVASHDRLLHPRFIMIGPDGAKVDRATYLKKWASGFDPDVITYWDVRDEQITLVGSTALVRSTNKQVVHRAGQDTASMSIYTDTYIYQDGKWRCIQAQITRVSPANEPSDSTIKTVYIRGVKQG
jgi:hypothetical protein